MDRRTFISLSASGLVAACGPRAKVSTQTSQAALLTSSGPRQFYDREGRGFSLDPLANVINRLDGGGSIGAFGLGAGQFNNAVAIAFDGNGTMYVLDRGNHRVQRFDRNGALIDQIGDRDTLFMPSGIAIDSADRMYIADTLNNRVTVWENTHIVDTHDGMNAPRGVALWPDDTLWVLDNGNRRIVSPAEGGSYPLPANVRAPVALAVTKSGEAYVSDLAYAGVHVFNRSGTYVSSLPITQDGKPAKVLAMNLDADGNVRLTTVL